MMIKSNEKPKKVTCRINSHGEHSARFTTTDNIQAYNTPLR